MSGVNNLQKDSFFVLAPSPVYQVKGFVNVLAGDKWSYAKILKDGHWVKTNENGKILRKDNDVIKVDRPDWVWCASVDDPFLLLKFKKLKFWAKQKRGFEILEENKALEIKEKRRLSPIPFF